MFLCYYVQSLVLLSVVMVDFPLFICYFHLKSVFLQHNNKNGKKKIDIAWSLLSADEDAELIKAIDEHWDELNRLIDEVFAGKKIKIKRIK